MKKKTTARGADKTLSEKELEKVTGGDKRETCSELCNMLGHVAMPNGTEHVGKNIDHAGTEGYPRQTVNQAAISPTIPTSPHSTYDAYLSLMKQLFESGAISEEVYAKWESMATVDLDTFQNEQRIEKGVEAAKDILKEIHQSTQPTAEKIDAMIAAQEQNATKNFPPADGDPETVSEK